MLYTILGTWMGDPILNSIFKKKSPPPCFLVCIQSIRWPLITFSIATNYCSHPSTQKTNSALAKTKVKTQAHTDVKTEDNCARFHHVQILTEILNTLQLMYTIFCQLLCTTLTFVDLFHQPLWMKQKCQWYNFPCSSDKQLKPTQALTLAEL